MSFPYTVEIWHVFEASRPDSIVMVFPHSPRSQNLGYASDNERPSLIEEQQQQKKKNLWLG